MAAAKYGALLEALRGVQWPARRVVPGTITGTHRARARGVSSEFTEYRAYRQGDDPRRLDWRLLARSDRAYIRLSTEHAQLRTLIAVDASASMAFPAGEGKWKHACRLAVGLAAVSHGDGDPVGCVVAAAGGYVRVEPRNRRGVVGEVARLVDSLACAGARPLAPIIAASRTAPRLVIISDLLGDLDAVLAGMRTHIAAGGEVHVVHVVAEEELRPREGVVTAVDPEDPQLRRPLVEATRGAYDVAFARWRQETAHACRASGATYLETVTGEPPDRVVRRVASGGAGQGDSSSRARDVAERAR